MGVAKFKLWKHSLTGESLCPRPEEAIPKNSGAGDTSARLAKLFGQLRWWTRCGCVRRAVGHQDLQPQPPQSTSRIQRRCDSCDLRSLWELDAEQKVAGMSRFV